MTPPACRPARMARLAAALALLLAAGPVPALAQMPGQGSFGGEKDGSAESVVNLKAYAEYKMGHYDEAKRIWEELAAKGNTTAMINLSNLFSQGNGVTADEEKAFGFTQKAADLGDARAQHDVGLAYEKGRPVSRDIAKAAEWLRKSAEQGYADGEFAYGLLLATGRGQGLEQASEPDRAEARKWLEQARDHGNVEAGQYIRTLPRPNG